MVVSYYIKLFFARGPTDNRHNRHNGISNKRKQRCVRHVLMRVKARRNASRHNGICNNTKQRCVRCLLMRVKTRAQERKKREARKAHIDDR